MQQEKAGEPRNDSKTESKLAKLARLLRSPIALGVVLFLFATSFPPFEVATETNLATHMLQHVLIAVGGVLIGYPLYRSGKFDRIRGRNTGLAGMAAVVAIVVAWHLPYFWDAAVESFEVHIAEHFCFLAVGILLGLAVPKLSDHLKLVFFVTAISAHMFYGLALFLINTPIYNSPVAQQSFLGVTLFAPSPVYFIGYLYFSLTNESRKIESEERALLEHQDPLYAARLRSEMSARAKRKSIAFSQIRAIAVPLLILVMVASLAAYFAIAGFAIAASYGQPHGVTVYIVENPYYWQYSPQTITVVQGVNSTVTWVSHSLSVDTVTSSGGLFNSGPLSSGMAFTYSFTQSGTYTYYCQYHPWMRGTVVVLPHP
jgi:plastocyanin